MNRKQYNAAKKLLGELLKKQWIGQEDYEDIHEVFIRMAFECDQAGALDFLNRLETHPRDKGYEILETTGAWKRWDAKVENNPGIPWLFRGREVKILDCFEIDEEEEKYTYLVKLEHNGRELTTYINSEDLEI
jgi:hypothetical protein